MTRYTLAVAIILLLIWHTEPVIAQDDLEALAAQAEQAYLGQNYALAISHYEQIVAAGVRDTGVYYNLASAYYQTGEIGWALLTYLRAAQLDPRSDRIQTQIALLRSERLNRLRSIAPPLPVRLAESTSDFRWAELRGGAWVLWLATCVMAVTTWFRPGSRAWLRYILALTGASALIAIGLLFARGTIDARMPAAVVVITSAEVYSGPGEDYLALYTLYAAAEVRILEARDGWARFLLPDGRYGWVDGAAIRRIDP
jgi:tetratricopeptide (TPR) repeat protein